MSTEDDIVTLRPYAWDGASKAALGRLVEQLEAAQKALRAFFAEFDDPDDKVSFYAPTGDTEALMRAALNPAKEPTT